MTDEDDLENITGEQLQEELDKIIRDYKQKKLETQQTLNNKTLDEKFIISVQSQSDADPFNNFYILKLKSINLSKT